LADDAAMLISEILAFINATCAEYRCADEEIKDQHTYMLRSGNRLLTIWKLGDTMLINLAGLEIALQFLIPGQAIDADIVFWNNGFIFKTSIAKRIRSLTSALEVFNRESFVVSPGYNYIYKRHGLFGPSSCVMGVNNYFCLIIDSECFRVEDRQIYFDA